MALRLSIGQYFPANSIIHRLDPRIKVPSALCVMVSVFFIVTPKQLAFGYASMLTLLICARIPAIKVLESIRPILFVLFFLSIFNLFLVRTGQKVWSWGILAITTEGIKAALLYSLRLVIAIVAAALMLLTTTPTQLTDAFDALLSPLSRVGLPGHELAMVFSLMLRFIPMLSDEAQAIMDAQSSRGARLDEGSLIHRAQTVAAILVALLASSLHHANNLSRALDARCYEGGAKRTHLHPLHVAPRDGMAALCVCIYSSLLIYLG